MFYRSFWSIISAVSIFAISGASLRADEFAAVDAIVAKLENAATEADLSVVLQIDHARLAGEQGVSMPPSKVTIVANVDLSSALMAQNPQVGLDLPLRALAYEDQGQASVIYTDAEFLRIRHDLKESAALSQFSNTLDMLLLALGDVPVKPVPVQNLTPGYGLIELPSAFAFLPTIERLKKAVQSQDDTVWFGEIDFAAEAKTVGVDLLPAAVLLFGGPAPGGVAMADFPSIGLDAFCQKLLVLQHKDGTVSVLFNSIQSMAELHYGASIKEHKGLDARLTATFSGAISPN